MSGVYLIAAASFTILGCYIAHIYEPPLLVIALMIIGASVSLFFLRQKEKWVLVCICILAAALGMLRIAIPGEWQGDDLPFRTEEQVTITGVVAGDIETGNVYDRYKVEVEKVNGSEIEKKGAVLVYEHYPTECVSGEEITFSGYLREPEDFLGSGGRIFKYKEYLRQRGIYATVFSPKHNSCRGQKVHHAPFADARKYLVKAMKKFLPDQETSLLSGLILGLRGSLSTDLLDAFRVTGLIHIIVLSGYNVTLVAETVRRMFSWTPRKVSFALSFVTIIGFVLLAGAQTAAVRAGSMATIALIAKIMHREYDGVRALFLIAAIMTLYNPDQVLFSISFHLSFLATLGLLLFSPIFERILRFIPEKFEMRGIVSSTIATQVFLLPYLAYAIGEVSIIGIPANILVLPLIPIAMLSGVVVTVLSALLTPVAVIIAPIAYLPLHAIIFLAEHLAQIPNATLVLPEVPILITLLITALLAFLGYEYTRIRKKESDTPD